MRTIALAVCLLLPRQADAVKQALASGEYRAAWTEMESQEDPVQRARQEAEILYRAGDPARALAAARHGLAKSPEHLELLYYAAGASIWLQDGTTGGEYTARMQHILENSPELAPSDRQQWQRVTSDFSARIRDLLAHANARDSAVALARALALGGLCAGLVICGLATRRTPG